jgi:hypothetical protein
MVEATLTSGHIITTMILDTIDSFYTIVTFVIFLFALLNSASVMWCEERIWNFRVLQRVHLSYLAVDKESLNNVFILLFPGLLGHVYEQKLVTKALQLCYKY